MTGCAQLPAPMDKTAPLEGGTSGEPTAAECNTAHIPGAYSCAMQAHLAKMRAERKTWKKNRPTNWTTELTDFFKLQLQNEDGYIDPQGLIKANRQREEMFATKNEIRRKNPQATFADAGIKSKADWQFIGPKNIGGRTRSLLFVKQKNGSTALYAGTATGGIWKSTDYGKTWNPPPEKLLLSGLPISTLAADPIPDPNTGYIPLYAGTGEQMNGTVDPNTFFQGSGILRSNDEGTTWEKIPSTDPKGASNSEWYYVNKIAISTNTPINGQAIRIAATGKGLRKQSLGKATEEWLPVSYGTSCGSYYLGEAVGDVKINPKDSNYVVASGLKTNVIYYSSDGGNNWDCTSLFNNGIKENDGRIELAFAKTITKQDASIPDNAPGVLYAAINSNDGAIYRSIDNGKSWQYRSNPRHFNVAGHNQGNYDNAIWVDPTDSSHLLIGGINVSRSTDGGNNFFPITEGLDSYSDPNAIHTDIHAIIEHPQYRTSNKEVFFGNDGGVYVATDISKMKDTRINDNQILTNNLSLMESRNKGLSVTQFYSGAGRTFSDGAIRIVGGTQDNFSLLYSNSFGDDWYPVHGGDGTFSAIQRNQGGNVFVSEFKATHLSRISLEVDSVGKLSFNSVEIPPANSGGLAISPFLLDPNNDNRMYVGKNTLYVSNDINNINVASGDDGWRLINHEKLIGTGVTAIAVTKGNPDLVWISQMPSPFSDSKAMSDGVYFFLKKIKRILSNTPALTLYPSPDLKPIPIVYQRFIHRILIDENNHNHLFVGLGSYSADNLQRSIDDGNSFLSISGIVPGKKLPDAPVHTIARHPNNPDWLYVGTGVGVYTTENAYVVQTKSSAECETLPEEIEKNDPRLEGCGVTWAINDGPANVDVHELFWLEDGRLGAATHGRGMWLAKLNTFTAPSTVTITDDGKTTLSASFAVDDSYRTPSKNELKIFVAAYVGGELYFKAKINNTDHWEKFDGQFIPHYEIRQIKESDKFLFQTVPIVEKLDASALKGTQVYVGYASCKNESVIKITKDNQGNNLNLTGVEFGGACWNDMTGDAEYNGRYGLVYTVQ